MERILVGSPVRQDPRILAEFLTSLLELETDSVTVDFAFVDDNDRPESSELLKAFRPPGGIRLAPGAGGGSPYLKDESTHAWREDLIWRVAWYKDGLIDLARTGSYDGLFLVDSDLVLHPSTLRQLINANVDIVSEIFWTRWLPDQPELPQVWHRDRYTLHRSHRGERLTGEEAARREEECLAELRRPGLYPVGGLGACTLISKRALDRGVSFREIPNLSFQGEDRHFCVRAMALGLNLYVDTHYPACHIYRESDLAGVAAYKAACRVRRAEMEALRTLKAALETRGTTHYESITGLEGLDHFTPEYRAGEEPGAEAVATVDRASRAVSRFHLLPPEQVAEAGGAVRVTGSALQTGRITGTPYQHHLSLEATLVPHQDRWLVAGVQFRPAQGTAPSIPFVRKSRNNRVTLSMIVKNEADKFLQRMLRHAAGYVDAAVIVDDASTDNTAAICREILREIPHTVISLTASLFHREYELRQKQWQLTVATNPDWILLLDSDQIFEDRIRQEIRPLVNQDEFDVVAFREYDLWDEEHYREDPYWQAHRFYKPFLIRHVPGLSDEWRQTNQHCGSFPPSVLSLPRVRSQVRLKHFGWSNPEDRVRKYERYMKLDPGGKFGILAQYESILDPNPRLIRWAEGPE